MQKTSHNIQSKQDLFFWLIIFYLFLEIIAPQNVYKFLEGIRVQLITIIFIFLALPFQKYRSFSFSLINLLIFLLCVSFLLSTMFSLDTEISWFTTNIYLKLVVFYFIILFCINSEFLLKSYIICFSLLITMYIILSFREYAVFGQHVYDMGVTRMLGWDRRLSPNQFGMLCVFSIPFSLLMLKKESYVPLVIAGRSWLSEKVLHFISYTSIVLAIICLFLTNSRTSLLLFIFLLVTYTIRFKKKIIFLLILVISLPIVFSILPDETKIRYASILINLGVMERNAPMTREEQWAEYSAQGRLFGLKRGLEIYKQHPIFGVGPGMFQHVSGNNLQAHNLLGQTASEVGSIGLFVFTSFLFTIYFKLKNKQTTNFPSSQNFYYESLRITTLDFFKLMLLGSIFSHTLFFSWWLFIASFCVLGLRYSYSIMPTCEGTEIQKDSNQIGI